ncbi:MAG: TetR/AcrR family transcriptional regulator [Roseburia sp.]
MQQKEVILEGTIKAFNEKGLKFTMDDVAKILGMSKKTIYTVFRDKESMFLAMVDYMFDSIKESEQQIVEDDALSTVEKIRRILGVIPESYRDVDFRQLYLLKDKYPVIYKQVEKDWRPAGRQRSSFWSREWRKAWSARSAFRS